MRKYNLHYEEASQTVFLVFEGFLNEQDFKQVWLEAVALIETHKAPYFFIDASQERIIPTGTEEWLINEFAPLAEKHAQKLGYRLRAARVESQDIFNRLASEKSILHFATSTQNFDFQNFSTKQEALTWLYQV